MDTNHEQNKQQENVPGEATETASLAMESFVAPGVPVVRSNTPRPRQAKTGQHQPGGQGQAAHASASAFPVKAPVAPPLPEECEEGEDNTVKIVASTPLPPAVKAESSNQDTAEFLWLFEYGLEMDASFLNSPERLKSLALTYGPAVLKGYRLALNGAEIQPGQVVASIVPDREPAAEVWGMLYRIPRRLTERQGDEPSLLDKVHGADVFESIEVIVYEAYRKREVRCRTYIASAAARQQFRLLPPGQQTPGASYVQQLLICAACQKLPNAYLQQLMRQVTPQASEQLAMLPLPVEHDTEPLPVVTGKMSAKKAVHNEQQNLSLKYPGPWLTAFAVYLVLLLLTTLILAVIQASGYWNQLITGSFLPLGVPWYVLVYGLLGACISSIVAVGRLQPAHPPAFVVLTWFTRPYIGAILAALAYLFLSSGLFVISGSAAQHYSLYSLVGALAGFCEGWLFFRRTPLQC